VDISNSKSGSFNLSQRRNIEQASFNYQSIMPGDEKSQTDDRRQRTCG